MLAESGQIGNHPKELVSHLGQHRPKSGNFGTGLSQEVDSTGRPKPESFCWYMLLSFPEPNIKQLSGRGYEVSRWNG